MNDKRRVQNQYRKEKSRPKESADNPQLELLKKLIKQTLDLAERYHRNDIKNAAKKLLHTLEMTRITDSDIEKHIQRMRNFLVQMTGNITTRQNNYQK